MLAFFPWLALREVLSIEGYSLIPFVRDQYPGGLLQPTIDNLLKHYTTNSGPIRNATLLTFAGRDLIQDLSDDERKNMFEFAEILAFMGLSEREYFSDFTYINRDKFAFLIQGFRESSQGAAITTRRRDGSSSDYWPSGTYEAQKPYNVGNDLVRFNVPLLSALLRARDISIWDRLEDAIYFFNHANTDSDQIAEQWEITAISGAFERIFDCRRGKEDDLADNFMGTWVPNEWIAPASCIRVPKERIQGRRMAEIWLRDFFQLRGHVGHGRKKPAQSQLWSSKEHLLLASYVFPLVTKLLLAKEQLYTVSTNDQSDIDVFEELAACTNLFKNDVGKNDEMEWPWIKIRFNTKFKG
jgi:hypothetical protein